MSPLEKPVPEAGEEIHLPGGSLQPLLLTLGITFSLVGVTISIVFVVLGGLLTVAVLGRWIADARRETAALPAEHEQH